MSAQEERVARHRLMHVPSVTVVSIRTQNELEKAGNQFHRCRGLRLGNSWEAALLILGGFE